MKNIYAIILGILLLNGAYNASGQSSFYVQHDTVYYAYTGVGVYNIQDDVVNPSTVPTDTVLIAWKVIATDFPADWQGATGICDNGGCFNFPLVWPTNEKYAKYPDGVGDFHVQIALTTTSPPFDASCGTHYVTVRMHNYYTPTDSATATFIISKCSTTSVPVAPKQADLLLYPNPAINELNVVYEASNDIKNIAVYNIIGKVMQVYKVSGNSANLNLENIPSGIYFVRLYNSVGNVVVTRKFTKQ